MRCSSDFTRSTPADHNQNPEAQRKHQPLKSQLRPLSSAPCSPRLQSNKQHFLKSYR
jgi:hypothetical protein